MSNVIEFPNNHLKRIHRHSTFYRCRHCGLGKRLEHGPVNVAPMQICDSYGGCGAEMSPIDENGRMEAR